MKKINELTVTVTYTVGLSDIEVNEQVYDALNALADRGSTNCGRKDCDEQIETAFGWLEDNILESDAYDWSYEVDID